MERLTLVLGASLKDYRYSNLCVRTLISAHIPVTAIGLREGNINNIQVHNSIPELEDIHTVTLYLGPENQKQYYDYILKLNPVRVIFNPGTENSEFSEILKNAGIEVIEDCTLMMVEGGRF
jgi:uncharacterized protein